jgi:hypothetical protein
MIGVNPPGNEEIFRSHAISRKTVVGTHRRGVRRRQSTLNPDAPAVRPYRNHPPPTFPRGIQSPFPPLRPTTDHGPRTTDHGPRTTDHGPRTTDHGPRTTDHGPRTKDQGPRTKDQGPRTKDQGPRTKDQGPRTKDQGPRTKDQGPRTKNQEPRTKNQEPRTALPFPSRQLRLRAGNGLVAGRGCP